MILSLKQGIACLGVFFYLISANASPLQFGFKVPEPIKSPLIAFFIDVGQGDSEFIELPNGKTVLIDGGPDMDLTYEFLNEKGIQHIDYMIMTHPHADHYNGLVEVFDKLQVDNFYDNHVNENRSDSGQDPGNRGPYIVRDKAQDEPVCQIHYPNPGDQLDWDPDVRVQVLNSCPDTVNSTAGADINNCSIVLRITYHDTPILFQGDAQKEAIAKMSQNYEGQLESEVLKVGHHGSKNGITPEWINLVNPKEAFIGVGKNNPYGHPTPYALTILQSAGVEVHRTDVDGTGDYLVP